MSRAVTMGDIRAATLAARERTGCAGIGTRVRAGRMQVVIVDYPQELRGRSRIVEMSDYLMPADALAFLHMVQS